MRKLIFSSLICLFTATQSKADPTLPYLVDFLYNANNCVCTSVSFTVQTQQASAPFGSPGTFTYPIAASNPLNTIGYGLYYATPSAFQQLTISVLSGGTAMVHNNAPGPQNLRMLVQLFPSGGGYPQLTYGTYVTVPGYSTAMLNIPAASLPYAAAIGSYDPSSTYPIPVVVDVSY